MTPLVLSALLFVGAFVTACLIGAVVWFAVERSRLNHEYRMSRMRYRYRWEAVYELLERNGLVADGGADFDDLAGQLDEIEDQLGAEVLGDG